MIKKGEDNRSSNKEVFETYSCCVLLLNEK